MTNMMAKISKAVRLQDVNRVLGDLVNETPFLSVEAVDGGTVWVEAQGYEGSQELLSAAVDALSEKFELVVRTRYGFIHDVTVTSSKVGA